jgi:hypothetical protein
VRDETPADHDTRPRSQKPSRAGLTRAEQEAFINQQFAQTAPVNRNKLLHWDNPGDLGLRYSTLHKARAVIRPYRWVGHKYNAPPDADQQRGDGAKTTHAADYAMHEFFTFLWDDWRGAGCRGLHLSTSMKHLAANGGIQSKIPSQNFPTGAVFQVNPFTRAHSPPRKFVNVV